MADTTVSLLIPRLAASQDINALLAPIYRLPTAVTWNRLEGRPRSNDLARALRAEVRDPLWMLSRQWQLGEFRGEDAGMPVRAKLAANVSTLSSVALHDHPARPYDAGVALEALVERQRVEPDLMMSLYLGRRWLVEMGKAFGVGDPVLASFTGVYAIAAPVQGGRDLESLKLTTNPVELQVRLASAGKSLDGARLFADIAAATAAGRTPSEVFVERGVLVDPAQSAAIDAVAAALASSIGLALPNGALEDAWVPERLEHSFTLGVGNADGTETKLIADQYAEGHLDWYSVDVAHGAPVPPTADNGVVTAAPERRVVSFVPTPIRFPGMPNVRWWEFEDRRVGFGLTTAAKTDLVKLLLAQFALVFSNDWFILPFAARIGSLVDTSGIVVTDNFGFNSFIEPTAKRQVDLALTGRWGMWTLTQRDAAANPSGVDPRFFLAPALARSLESKPLDEVVFLRDEMANLVWGVETVFPDSMGGGRDARAAGKLLRDAIARSYPEAPPVGDQADDVPLVYQLMGSVPENWTPFVSVRMEGESVASVFLQGAMPRVPSLDPSHDGAGDPLLAHNVVLPRGTLLARDPVADPNVVNQEEILRGGALVKRTFQQARWHDGATFLWSGRRKQNGRGEGSSGLAFDQVTLTKPDE